ncbi:hypothetical protein BJ875DRAFT_441561 [Amylocarpus encephaloides]|uniref:Uncharacterized protein n=1 Tax=Amylocarpus encephaloides TaxID=45428 RepID=A0A9P7YHY1_9HELO|nr:hypothetical protein BJ875DRAFT_441561 [Amylocarpus encephaloides]
MLGGELETCWNKCSAQDHVYAPRFISEYCSNLDNSFELPGLRIQIGKRQESGFSGIPIPTTSILTTPTQTASIETHEVPSATTISGTRFPTFTPPSDKNEGLSTGAKIGIGVAIPLVGLIGIGMFAFWFFHIRKKRKALYAPEYQDTYSGLPELGGGADFPNELAGEATMAQTSDTKKGSILRHLGIGEAVAVEKTTGEKTPKAAKYRTASSEPGGVMVSEMDGHSQPPMTFELPNQPSSKSSSPMQRKPAPMVSPGEGASTSGFPAPWQSTGVEGFAMPAMTANLGSASTKSLPLQENKPTSATQPQFSITTPRPQQSHISQSDSTSASHTLIPHPSRTDSPTSMNTPRTAFSAPSAQSSSPGTPQDQELATMEREMAAIREKKERLKQVAELEEREEALRIGIEARKSQMSVVPSGSRPS